MAVSQHRRELSAFLDVLLAVLAYLAVAQWHLHGLAHAGDWYIEMIPLVLGIWWLLSSLVRRDVSYRLGGSGHEVWETLLINGAGAVLVLALNLLTKHDAVSRLVLTLFPLLSCALSIVLRLAARSTLALWRSRGYDTRHVVLVGPAEASLRWAPGVLRDEAGLRPVGLVVPPGRDAPRPASLPLLGEYPQLVDILHQHVVDQVAVTAPLDDPGLRPAVEVAIREGKTVWLVLDAFGARLMGDGTAGQVVVLSPVRDSYSLLLKRCLDIVVSAVSLCVLSPVLGACALAIWLDDRTAPVIFRQRRVGLHGRSFTCLKFRSMVPDAERRRRELLHRNEMDGPVFKIHDDPRITRVGRALRRYSLDEVPQLWNVLCGDMSLVGPRPPLPDEVAEYQPEFRRRLAFRPGLTCLWQVSGRNNIDFQRWMELDLRYVDNWSFWLDVQILLRTIPVVLFGSGM